MPERARTLAAGLLPMLLLAGSPPAAAQGFDRLFTTPAERRLLDQARAQYQQPAPEPEPEPQPSLSLAPEEPSGPVVPEISVGGVVLRHRGGDTSWINGSGMSASEVTAEGIRVAPQGGRRPAVQIMLPDAEAPIALRPGQRIDLATGVVLDAWERQPEDEQPSVFEGLLPDTPETPASPGAAATDSPAEPVAGGG